MNGTRTLRKFGRFGMTVTPVVLTLLIGKEAGLFGGGPQAGSPAGMDENFRSVTATILLPHTLDVPAVTFGAVTVPAVQVGRQTSHAPAAHPGPVSVRPIPAPDVGFAAGEPVTTLATSEIADPGVKTELVALVTPALALQTVPVTAPDQVTPAPERTLDSPVPTPAIAVDLAVAAASPTGEPAQVVPEAGPPTLVAAEPPAAAASAAPPVKLAVADWNYWLPQQSEVAGGNALVDATASRPATAPTAGLPSAANTRLAPPSARASTVAGSRATTAPARQGHSQYRLVGGTVEFQMPVVANGESLGNLTVHVSPNQELSLHLKELVALFADRIDPQARSAIEASRSVEEFVSFERLRETGIDVRYDAARERLNLSVDDQP